MRKETRRFLEWAEEAIELTGEEYGDKEQLGTGLLQAQEDINDKDGYRTSTVVLALMNFLMILAIAVMA